MKTRVDLLSDSPSRVFFKYLVPSISATLVTSIYILADTIIVGKGIGPDAVAALNLVLPLYSIIFGIGALFGIGGAVLMSVAKGQGNEQGMKQYFTTALLLLAFFAITFAGACLIFQEPLIEILGVTKETRQYVLEYNRFFFWGIPVFGCSAFLQAFVRNDGNPKLAMIGVITGGISNIILDLLFVYGFHLGMGGAALASVIGVLLTCFILCAHFFTKQNQLKLSLQGVGRSHVGEIVKNGFSSFIVEIASGVVTFVFNIQLLRYLGNEGVTIYSIICNTALIMSSLSNGISQAAQPIIAINYGAKKMERIVVVQKLGIKVSAFAGGILTVIGLLFPTFIVSLFLGEGTTVGLDAILPIRIYFISFIAMAVNIFFANYFQAILKPKNALVLCLLRGLVLSILFVQILPMCFGAIGIWFTMIFVETITFVVGIVMIKKQKRV